MLRNFRNFVKLGYYLFTKLYMKKIIAILCLFLFLTACGQPVKPEYMDQLASDGNFYYTNEDLEFTVILPPEFIYYQTQRVKTDYYIDIEFFVPTSDTSYPQLVSGYARPLIIRAYSEYGWTQITDMDAISENYKQVGKNNGNIYLFKFWDRFPDDWKNKWSEEIRKNILENFSFN